jgi:G6PDH family F420-dependent oxidoreductase
MVAFGYSLLCEQRGPRELVSDAVGAEEAGFDFAVISDHCFPWLDSQGHAPNAWPVLGAVAAATERIPLMTYVTCPTMRYHPVVVAQQAATVALLAGNGRFCLGLGSGENLNEHVIGAGWPPVNVRHEMLGEALEIIGELFTGGYVNRSGTHYRVDSAKLWDCPEAGVPIAVAVSGEQSVESFARVADAMVAVEPQPELVRALDYAAGTNWVAAVARAHDQFRWFAGGWKVNAELPGTAAFAAATQFVTPTTSRARSRAGRTWRRTSRQCARSSMRASPTSPWCRWAVSRSPPTWPSPSGSCSPRCARSTASRRLPPSGCVDWKGLQGLHRLLSLVG